MVWCVEACGVSMRETNVSTVKGRRGGSGGGSGSESESKVRQGRGRVLASPGHVGYPSDGTDGYGAHGESQGEVQYQPAATYRCSARPAKVKYLPDVAFLWLL